jgi:pimeloyl-ACP methyl ester carboxylesterase
MNSWLDTSEYPFDSNFFDINGSRLHYIDEGKGETILFVHGTPSWSFDFRNVIKVLRSRYRCVAVDHIGFGLSEKPEYFDYSTRSHSDTLEQFVLHKGLESITLVVHDFGGPIGLNFAMRHPARVRNLVILNSWLWSTSAKPEFKKLSKFLQSPLLPFLYRYLNFSPRFILPSTFGERKLAGKLMKQYTKPFADKSQRNGTLAFARSLLRDQEWFESLWTNRKSICDKPTLLIWGLKDPLLKQEYLEKFLSGFPGSTALRLEQSGHFPQEEQPLEVAQAIMKFLIANRAK